MGEVTQADLDRLRREVEETRVLVEVAVRQWLGKDWTQERLQDWLDGELERREWARAFGKDGVHGKGASSSAVWALIGAGIKTLDDLARTPRADVARMPGVGRVSIAKLDAALAERGLSWAEAV